MKIKSTNIKPLDTLIEREGISAYIRDYDAAINSRLNILYADDDFYIAGDMTYQPWLSIMGCLPEN